MQIDARLNDIDDCLYRVAVRVLIIDNDEVLLVRENEDWWAFPGGGVDHGETVESTLVREIEEELGVPAQDVVSDFEIVHYDIGNIVNTIPRMNLFFRASIPAELLGTTDHVAEWKWFTKQEFLDIALQASYDKAQLTRVIFGD